MNGYEAAFKGAMNAYGILAIKAVRMINHVTGLAGDSVEHYWPTECEQCKEVSAFLEEWQDTRSPTLRAPAEAGEKPLRCPGCGELKIEERIYCTNCGTWLPRLGG